MRRILTTAAATAITLTPLIASATGPTSTLTTNLVATGSVVAGCTAVSQSSSLAFGTTIAPGAQPTAVGGISTTCATGVPATITFANSTGSASPETLTGGTGGTLAYGLFSDTGFATAITTAGISVTGSGVAQISKVYAKLSAAVPADTTTGAYTDTIAVTLTF